MDISSLAAVSGLERVSRYEPMQSLEDMKKTKGTESFDSLLNSALNLIKQTEDYSNQSEVEKIKYAAGESDSMHDLLIAQQKASVSLQYTVAVKNTAVEAYKTLMNMQF